MRNYLDRLVERARPELAPRNAVVPARAPRSSGMPDDPFDADPVVTPAVWPHTPPAAPRVESVATERPPATPRSSPAPLVSPSDPVSVVPAAQDRERVVDVVSRERRVAPEIVREPATRIATADGPARSTVSETRVIEATHTERVLVPSPSVPLQRADDREEPAARTRHRAPVSMDGELPPREVPRATASPRSRDGHEAVPSVRPRDLRDAAPTLLRREDRDIPSVQPRPVVSAPVPVAPAVPSPRRAEPRRDSAKLVIGQLVVEMVPRTQSTAAPAPTTPPPTVVVAQPAPSPPPGILHRGFGLGQS